MTIFTKCRLGLIGMMIAVAALFGLATAFFLFYGQDEPSEQIASPIVSPLPELTIEEGQPAPEVVTPPAIELPPPVTGRFEWSEDAVGVSLTLPDDWQPMYVSRQPNWNALAADEKPQVSATLQRKDDPSRLPEADWHFGVMIVTAFQTSEPLDQTVELLYDSDATIAKYGLSEVVGYPAWRIGDLDVVELDGGRLNFEENVVLRDGRWTYWLRYYGGAVNETDLTVVQEEWRETLASVRLRVPASGDN